MGQQVSLTDLKIPDLLSTNNQQPNEVLSDDQTEDIHLFLPLDIIKEINKNSSELSIAKEKLIHQIRNDISVSSNLSVVNEFNAKIVEIIKKTLDYIATQHTCLQNSIQSIINKQKQLKDSYGEKLKDDENATTSIFPEALIDSEKVSHEQQLKELSFFAVESLITMLLMLLKSVHKSDSTIVHQMLTLKNQLLERIPLNYISSDICKRSNNLFKSLKPLTNYIQELSMQTDIDPFAANQSIKILFNFSVLKASLKDILPLIRKLIFNTNDIFDVRELFVKLNKHLMIRMDQFEKEKQTPSIATTIPQNTTNNNNLTTQEQNKTDKVLQTATELNIEQRFLAAVEYLKSIEAYPNTQLIKLNEKKFTGQFICSVLLVHIDLHNQIHAKSQFECSSMNGSFSFELEPETFKYLYELIEQLTAIQASSDANLEYILNVCLRLFTTHLQFLIDANFDNFHEFLNEHDIENWFALISRLALDDKLEENKNEASRALAYLIEKQTLSFGKMLTFIHKHIIENKHPILIDQLLNKLNKPVFIYRWIEILCDNQDTQDSALAYIVLHSFIDIVLKSTLTNIETVNRLREILIIFQELLLVHLNNQPADISDELGSSALATLGIEYTARVIKACLQQEIQSVLFESLLLGLCTLTESQFNFAIIQPIFATIMPLFAEHVTRKKIDIDDKTSYLMSWLLGKMSYRLIVGPSQSPLEKKYNTTLKLPIFSGGYETLTEDINPYLSNLFKSDLSIYSRFMLPLRRQQSILDNDFLISIYRNKDQGAQLISKMKLFIRNKQNVLQSVEAVADEACAAVFAVYIKHYRRIELAQDELTRPIEQKPYAKLLLLYEYANQVRTIFATTKARGGDCDEVCKKIKKDALLLLLSIRESSFIAKMQESFSLPIVVTKKYQLQRQQSHWTKAKCIIRLLRNTFNACIRLKYLMLEKKRAVEQKNDSESVMHRAIVTCLYGNEMSASTENEKLKIEYDEIVKCLTRQYQRAMTRLITYRFIEQLIITGQDKNRIVNILLMTLKDNNLEWHYLENIQASNNQLKEDIGNLYYKIIKNILSFSMESNMKIVLMLRVFNLINLNYDSMDLCLLNNFQLIQEIFDVLIKFVEISTTNDADSMTMKHTAFNWFRLVVFKLCEHIALEQLRNMDLGNRKFHHILKQQRSLIFNKLILWELKGLQQNKYEDTSLKNVSLRSFVSSSKFNVDICINQYLMLLLRCIHLYDHIRLNYATIDYMEQLFNLYHTSRSLNNRLLALKILRDLLICLPDDTIGTTNRSFIENLLTEILFSIGQNFNLLETEKIDLDITIEFIYIYRMIISHNSPWQAFASKLLVDAIKSCMNFNFTLLEAVDSQQMNFFLASICILGGYVPPYCLGSTVEIYSTDINMDELQSGIIVEINMDALTSDASDVKPYLVQYAVTNQTEWVSSNKIRIIIDVLPTNLSLLPVDNVVHTILDTLGFLAQIDTSISDSLMLLDIKCRVVTAFHAVLSYKQVIEIFMQKPYAPIIAKLSTSMDYFDSVRSTVPNDLRMFNRSHLEQYYLSLYRYAIRNQTVENNVNIIHNKNRWNQMKIIRDPMILQYLSETGSIDENWKPIASKSEIKFYKKGRLGNDEIRIISLPANDNLPALEECGMKHKFKGRVHITNYAGNIRYATFIPDGIELNEGKWYFCVKFPRGGVAEIGWATKEFNPQRHDSYGIGSDDFSWGFNGKKGFYKSNEIIIFSEGDDWNEGSVCGCGIEINGTNTNIKYWLDGKSLGTVFSHSENEAVELEDEPSESEIKTDLLPSGAFASYFPAVTVKFSRNSTNNGIFEFIFSPEDMTECPLPKGYKPLLVPKLLTMENVLVAYPYSAYLIGNRIQQYFYTSRCAKNESTDKKTLLRDFINDEHFEVPFNADTITANDNLLRLTKENDGFSLSLDNQQSLTISFDFEIVPADEAASCPNQLDIVLFTLDDATFSIRVCMNDINDDFIDETRIHQQRVVILFQLNEQVKVYFNNNVQMLNYCHSFDPKTNSKLNLRLLPHVNAGIRNLGIWKYILLEEHIRRLFTYGLSYVAIDYQKLNKWKNQLNTIKFKADQKYFANEILVPFNEPFEKDLWEETKQYIDYGESNYFKTIPNTNQSAIQFFGNKTYLILNTANQVWSEYTVILDISIPNYPLAKNLSRSEARLTLLTLDTESEIYLTHDGHLHVTGDHHSSSTVLLNEYIRLLISVQQNSLQIYANGSLEIDISLSDDQFATKLKRIDLFRELDATKNTTNGDQLRIECRSITYLNQSTHILPSSMKKLIQSAEHCLDQLVAPLFSIVSASLIGIGYSEESIKYVMKKYNTTNIYFMDKILQEESQRIENIFQQEQQQKRRNVLTRLSPYDENGTLSMLMDTGDVTADLSISTLKSEIDNDADDMPSDKKWYYETVHSVGIRDKLDDWLRDKEANNQLTAGYSDYKNPDLTKADFDETESSIKFKSAMETSSHYVHRQIPREIYIHSSITCAYGLIAIYAHYTILNMVKVWCSDDHSSLFPFSQFGDGDFIVKLLRSMDHHHAHTRMFADETINRMNVLVISIIQVELKDLLKCIVNEKLTVETLNRNAPIFYHLQKHIVEESIHFLAEPSLIDMNNNNNATIDAQIVIKQSNLDFLLKIFRLFSEVLKDFEGKNDDIDLLIRLLFPNIVIKILFDLFLVVPSHQLKLFIIGLFTKLIQASENFKLHDDIRNFTRHMFIESHINEMYLNSFALKHFRCSLMHLELIQIEREKQSASPLTQWSPFMKNLAIVFDLINILTNKIKPCQWPEIFFVESKEILGESLTLTKEVFETAHSHFDRTADDQLIKFMNQNIKLNENAWSHESAIDFIKTLSNESTPDSTAYASFASLCNIPSVCIQTRVKFFYLFNNFLAKILPRIDFSVPPGISFIADRIRSIRHCILFAVKFEIFTGALDKTANDSNPSNINFDIVKASVAAHPEDTMFYQAYKQLKSNASRIFRISTDERAWKATYVGMFSNDQGGPYRDSVTRICADICSTRLLLFILCPNGRVNIGSNRDRWIPNVFPPNRSIPTDIKNQYRFVGQLMGMAIRTKQYLDVRFPILLWKQLIYEEATIEDIEAIDISSFAIINKMEENIRKVKTLNTCNDGDVNNNGDYLFSSIMTELTFDVVSSTGQTYELIPGGFRIPINTANFEDYCMHYRQYRINEFHRQIEFIRQGLYSVVPWANMTLFTAHELEEAVCGKGYIDIEMLKRHTRYKNDSASSQRIQQFWSVFSEMFSEEQRKLFLIFVWGRSTVPYRDEDFSTKFTIANLQTSGDVDKLLPKSYTCTFTLHLPAYSTKEIMYERLNYAITYCSSIDTDGRMN
ncbi:unnamed protein product [Rotaria socialis]|uniref:Uncharacterized protein n=4 Tax=Rotaria socialis TaxID=392032 RepID=A0A818DXV5_9BILA|nr:unnamed protein product [Rotaria socialis]